MQTRVGRLRIAAGLAVAASLAFATGAAADTVQVDTNVDENDTGADCSLREATETVNNGSDFGGCTLQAAGGADTITFDPAFFPVDGTPQTIELNTTGTQLVIDIADGNAVEIQGPGSGELTVTNSTGTDRIFLTDEDSSGDTVLISGLTISGGKQEGPGNPPDGSWRGGGILNHADLTLDDVVLTGNTVSAHGDESLMPEAFAEGGGIYTDNDLTVDSSVIELNQADADNTDSADSGVLNVEARGAGIFHAGGALTVANSRIEENAAAVEDQSLDAVGEDVATGAGIHAGPSAVIEQSTLSFNSVSATGVTGEVDAKGGGAMLGDGARVELSTITANSAGGSSPGGTDFRGAGLHLAGGSAVVSSTIAGNGDDAVDTDGANLTEEGVGAATVTNTIVAEPVGDAPPGTTNCTGSLVSGGFNVEYDPDSTAASCNFIQTSDLPDPGDVPGGTDPKLNPLADNGGFGPTMLPQPGSPVSPVIDKGDSTAQTVVDEDQRGQERGLTHAQFASISNAPLGDGSDIGAVEVQIAPPTFTATTPASPNIDDTPNVLGAVSPADSVGPLTVRVFTDPSCVVPSGTAADPSVFESPGIVASPPVPHNNVTTTFHGTVQTDYGVSHCSTGAFPNTIRYQNTLIDPVPPVVTPPPVTTTPAPTTKKKCKKKGFVRKKGKCVKKKCKKKGFVRKKGKCVKRKKKKRRKG